MSTGQAATTGVIVCIDAKTGQAQATKNASAGEPVAAGETKLSSALLAHIQAETGAANEAAVLAALGVLDKREEQIAEK